MSKDIKQPISQEEAVDVLRKYADISGINPEEMDDPQQQKTAVFVTLFELNRSIKFSKMCLSAPDEHAASIASSMQVTTYLGMNFMMGEERTNALMPPPEDYAKKEARMLAIQFRHTADEHSAAIELLTEKRQEIIEAAEVLGIDHNSSPVQELDHPSA